MLGTQWLILLNSTTHQNQPLIRHWCLNRDSSQGTWTSLWSCLIQNTTWYYRTTSTQMATHNGSSSEWGTLGRGRRSSSTCSILLSLIRSTITAWKSCASLRRRRLSQVENGSDRGPRSLTMRITSENRVFISSSTHLPSLMNSLMMTIRFTSHIRCLTPTLTYNVISTDTKRWTKLTSSERRSVGRLLAISVSISWFLAELRKARRRRRKVWLSPLVYTQVSQTGRGWWEELWSSWWVRVRKLRCFVNSTSSR